MRNYLPLLLTCLVATSAASLGCGKRPRRDDLSRYERKGNKERVLVFVHGIFGDSIDTWKCATGTTWPRLILNDSAFDRSDIYVVAYDTPYFGNRMTIDEIVASVDNRLVSDSIFTDHHDVIFIAHSMGGLVVQQLLLTHRKYSTQVPLIYFFSTPETGSQLAGLAHSFSADPLLEQMIPGDNNFYLSNMENQWREAGFESIRRYCAYEKGSTNGFIVVDRLSGTRGCNKATPINKNHSEIVKPCSPNDDAYIALRNAIKALTEAPEPARLIMEPHPKTSRPQTLKLSGVIYDEAGFPLAAVRVQLPEYRKQAVTDSMGRFEFAIPNAEQVMVKLVALKEGYEPLHADPTLGDSSLNFSLNPIH